MNKPTIRHNSSALIDAIRESGKAPDSQMAYAYAVGMMWSTLTAEQQARLVEIARA